VQKSIEERRIEALEEALLEYIGRYGPTELAMKAIQMGATASPDNSTDKTLNGVVDAQSELHRR
jgi:hypothetical protein